MGRGRVKLTEVNPHLVCVLCRGYLIDATTITECLHSFCRSCIILYLETKSYCPICEVQIHKTKPYLNLKLDKTLQDIVYKLVPGLFHNEMRRRQEFYKSHPLHDRHLHPESRGVAIDRLIYSPDDSISLSLEYYDKQREKEEWTSVGDSSAVATHGAEGKRYLLCPAVVTMAHIKKFLRSKYNLPETANVEVLYRRESLPDSYSLMDVAYIYTWKQNEPMRFYYSIHLLTKRLQELTLIKSIDVGDDNQECEQIKIKKNGFIKEPSIINIKRPPALPGVPLKSMDLPFKWQKNASQNVSKYSTVSNAYRHQMFNNSCREYVNGLSDTSRNLNMQEAANIKNVLGNSEIESKTFKGSFGITNGNPSKAVNVPNEESTSKAKEQVNVPKADVNAKKEISPDSSNADKTLCNSNVENTQSLKLTMSEKIPNVIVKETKVNSMKDDPSNIVSLVRTPQENKPISLQSRNHQLDTVKNDSLNGSNTLNVRNLSHSHQAKLTNKIQLKNTSSQLVNGNATAGIESRKHVKENILTECENTKDSSLSNSLHEPSEETNQLSNQRLELENISSNSTVQTNANENPPAEKIQTLTTCDELNELPILDETSSALLSAIGLKPKPKTSPTKMNENIDVSSKHQNQNGDKSEDMTKQTKVESGAIENVTNVSDSSKLLDNNETPLSLLLGFTNSHDSKIDALQNTGNVVATQLLQRSESNNKSPINRIQNVVNNITSPSDVPFKTPILSRATNIEHTVKKTGLLKEENNHTQTNGFKVPMLPSINENKIFNGAKLNNVSKSLMLKQPKNLMSETHKIEEHPKSINSNSDVSKQLPVGDHTNKEYARLCDSRKLFPIKQFSNKKKTDKADEASKTSSHLDANGYSNEPIANTFTRIPFPHTVSLKIPIPKQLSPEKKNNASSLTNCRIPINSHNNNLTKNPNIDVKMNKDCIPGFNKDAQKIIMPTKDFHSVTVRKSTSGSKALSPDMKRYSKTPESMSETKAGFLRKQLNAQKSTKSVSETKVDLLKKKFNSQQNECDVLVSAATRDESLSEAKRRRQVTPDVSIELLSRSPNERGSTKRPLFELPSLSKKPCLDLKHTNSLENNQMEATCIKINTGSLVKAGNASPNSVCNSSSKTLLKEKHSIDTISENAEILRSVTPKSDAENKNSAGDDATPDITIEKMKENSKYSMKRSASDIECELNVTKVVDVPNTNSDSLRKRQTESRSPSVNDSSSPQGTKKLPRLIEINAPPRPKLDPTFHERKNQRTGLKMTTVRKEVPIGKEVPMVRKDVNGALDLSGRGIVAKQSTSRLTPVMSPAEMFPATLHQLFRQQLELQGQLLASHANNNLANDWSKNPIMDKHFEDWVRNAVSCGTLPPHPLMFNAPPAPASPAPHRK